MTTLGARSASIAHAQREAVACSHCGLPVPRGLVEESAEHQFCCNGCRTVFGVLRGGGLERYYAVRDSVRAERRAALTTDADFAEMDDPVYMDQFVRVREDGFCETDLVLEGVHCAACVWLVERLDRVSPAVVSSRLDLRRATVSVAWNPNAGSLPGVARSLASLGYTPHPPRGGAREAVRRSENRTYLIRCAVAGALAGNIMLIAIALYGGWFAGMSHEFQTFFRWLSAGLGLTSLAWPGRVFFAGAINALRTRTANLDLPIALALGVGGVWGIANTITGAGEIYFDSLGMLVFLLLVGRWIQHAQQRRAADAVELLFTLTPTRARLLDGRGDARSVPADTLQVDDRVEVLADDTVPADGEVVEGQSDVDEALLTGESRPRRVGGGDVVSAGSVNLSGRLVVRVAAPVQEARIAQLMRLVSEATSAKSRVVKFADRIAGWFVLVVMVLASVTAAVWWPSGAHGAMEHATALLIVACPCALGLATPLVMTVSIGRLARMGVLVKSADVIERLSRPGRLMLDKTGTLTEGTLTVAERVGEDHAWALAAIAERESRHPVARAITQAFATPASELAVAADDLHARPGLGVEAIVGEQRVAVGSARLMETLGVVLDDDARDWIEARANAGSPVFVSLDGTLAGIAVLDDSLRSGSLRSTRTLRKNGWRASVLSGDRAATVARIAGELGIEDACGEVTPEQKLEAVRHASGANASRGPVVMVGDGVNDAAAIAAADVGIAVQGGAEASLEAADVACQRVGLEPIVDLIDESRRAMRRVRLCLCCSLGYNAVAAGCAMAGLVTPLFAAVLMPLSSLTVLTIAASGGARRSSNDGGGA
ncbi:MAG: heavy metal translocating P-type ATPase [Planctomycetota bacterium]